MSASAKASYFLRSALQGMRHAPFVHLVAVVTLSIALFAVGLARGGALWVERLVHSLESQVQMTVYLAPGATEPQVDAAASEVAQAVGARPRVVSPKEALGRLAAELGSPGDVLKDLKENPLPTTLEVDVPPGRRSPGALRGVAEVIRKTPAVDSVDYGEEAVERLAAIARVLAVFGGFALLIVSVATVVIVSATLQLAMYARREEVEIQKLVGATDRFVKTPFLIEGLLQGLVGALAAFLGLAAFFGWAGPHLAEAFRFLKVEGGAGSLLSLDLALELFGVGAGLGLLGSFVAVGRFLKT